jgi:CPA2 family monovalent cation:H+ antiporter-2
MQFFYELAMVLAAALAGSALARLLKQPAILGYILGGILISPFTWGPSIADVHSFDDIAEFGVVLLMFSIGAEFSPKELGSLRKVALLGVPLGIAVFIGISLGVGQLLGWSVLKSIALGAIISVASTMVLGRMLIDHGRLKTEVGRLAIGLSLVDDLAVVIMIVLLPVLGELTPDRLYSLGLGLGRAFLILLPVLVLSRHLVPWLLKQISSWNNPEFLFLATVALSVLAATFTQWLGLSMALGAFLAGVMLSNSPEGRRAVEHLHGLRDLCVAVFFVSVGALIDPGMLGEEIGLVVTLLLLVVVGKLVVWWGIIRLFGYPNSTARTSAVYLAQIGEFSFILGTVAMSGGLLTQADYNAVLAAALLSMAANSFLTKLTMGSASRGKAR